MNPKIKVENLTKIFGRNPKSVLAKLKAVCPKIKSFKKQDTL